MTGAAGILGPEISIALACRRARVALLDRDADACRQAAERVGRETGADALVVVADVSDEASVSQALRQVTGALGAPHILVNAAATKSPGYFRPLESYQLADWEKVVATNLTGMFLVTKHAIQPMIDAGAGVIINIASMYGVVGPDPGLYEGSRYLGQAINTPSVYAASKAGVIGFTRHLATTLAPHGIRANAISPGGVESGQNETFVRRYSERSPLGRMARRDELRGPVQFLASDASSYVSGHNLVVDGGWTAR